MNPYSVLPVWSFNGPSRHDGFNVVRFANLYWLVTVSGFQGSGCGGYGTCPAVSPAACRCVVFGGKEKDYSFSLAVSTTPWNILATRCRVSSRTITRDENASLDRSERRIHTTNSHVLHVAHPRLCDSLSAAGFQLALRSQIEAPSCGSRTLSSHQQRMQGFRENGRKAIQDCGSRAGGPSPCSLWPSGLRRTGKATFAHLNQLVEEY